MSLTALRTEDFRFSQPAPPSRSSAGAGPSPADGVLLDEVQPLDRDEELRVARVAQVDHLAHDARVVDRREAREAAEAVVAVDDDVPDPQVAQVGEERLGRRLPPRRRGARLAEEVRRREEEDARAAGTGSPRRGPPDDDAARARRERRGRVAVRALVVDLVLGEEALDVLALALRRGGEDDREAVLPRARDLLRRVREPVLEGEDRLGADRDGLARGDGGREGEERSAARRPRRAGPRRPRGASGSGATRPAARAFS